jgi:hypothetical protein
LVGFHLAHLITYAGYWRYFFFCLSVCFTAFDRNLGQDHRTSKNLLFSRYYALVFVWVSLFVFLLTLFSLSQFWKKTQLLIFFRCCNNFFFFHRFLLLQMFIFSSIYNSLSFEVARVAIWERNRKSKHNLLCFIIALFFVAIEVNYQTHKKYLKLCRWNEM